MFLDSFNISSTSLTLRPFIFLTFSKASGLISPKVNLPVSSINLGPFPVVEVSASLIILTTPSLVFEH